MKTNFSFAALSALAACSFTLDAIAAPIAVPDAYPDPLLIGQDLTLDGSGSTDDGDPITSWLWDFDNDGQYDDAGGEFVNVPWTTVDSVTGGAPGEYFYGLRVGDSGGQFNSATASYMITAAAVPLPASTYLFGSALGLLGWVRKSCHKIANCDGFVSNIGGVNYSGQAHDTHHRQCVKKFLLHGD